MGPLTCPACAKRLDAGLACASCGAWPTVEGIPVLLRWAKGRRFDLLELLLMHRGAVETWGAKLARRLLPARKRLERTLADPNLTLAGYFEALERPKDAAYFGARESSPAWKAAKALAGLLPEGDVLEIGCGPGHLLKELARPGRRIVGLDVNFAMLYAAKRFLAPGAELVCGDLAGGLPFADGAFTSAVSVDVLPYLEAPGEAVKEAARVASKALIFGHVSDPDSPSAGARSRPSPPELARLLEGRNPLLHEERAFLATLEAKGSCDLSRPVAAPKGPAILTAGLGSVLRAGDPPRSP
jgi:SAM-dependent methyltransferase